MANEAVILRRYGNNGDLADFTCANATAITKGAVLILTDPDTAIINSAAAQAVAGIAAMAKEASDGATRISVVTNCDAKVYASGAITAGNPIVTAVGLPNFFACAGATYHVSSGAITAGWAKETAADGETFIARILV